MQTVSGTILLVQEGRFRLLTEDGRGLTFLLAHDAAIEPQDLPALTHRRVRVEYEDSPNLVAGIVSGLVMLDGKDARR
jgi:hypothetical protein